MDKFELLAKFHGYTNVLDFANMTYDFWDIHHNHVRKLEEENLLLKQYVKKLKKILSQNNKKIARLHEWSELMQVVTACSMLDGKFPPPNLLYTLSKTYRTVVE